MSKKENYKRMVKNEKGSITTVVLVTLLFFLVILSTAYAVTAAIRKGQLKAQIAIKETYENEINSRENIEKEFTKKEVNGIIIPTGFYYVGGTKTSGLVISDEPEDENKYKDEKNVGTDLKGNQFVWIPVDNISDYKRTPYLSNILDSDNTRIWNSDNTVFFKEEMPENERISVETYHGFYIGRYEAGNAESTITLKKGQAPYCNVTKEEAQTLAEGMATKQGYSATTKLCSSYAWDTAIAFMQKTNSDYGSSSEEGNYKDVLDFIYTNIAGEQELKKYGETYLIPTGQTKPVCNIYDMGGNCWEWTTETFVSGSDEHDTRRGGSCFSKYSTYSAGYRDDYVDDNAANYYSFRITLFMNP